MCGQTFSDDVLNIDDTILDEYENELDYKSGKLFTLTESKIEKDLVDRKDGVLSSTAKTAGKDETSSDEFEKCMCHIQHIFCVCLCDN